MTVRYAVVGAGWISQIAFMPGVDLTGNSKMTAIVTGNPEGAAKLADFYGIEHVYSYEQYDEMLAADVVDAVYIALPNSMHADYTIRAARAGKHALVEKPLAVTEAECEAMIDAADKAGVYLMTAYRLHSEPANVEVLEQIRSGAIGQPRIFSSVFSFHTFAGNHRLKSEHWGGPLQDIGVYCLNAARHVFAAEPVEASAMKYHGDNPMFAEVEESIAVNLRFPEGGLAQFTVSFGAEEVDRFSVVGTEGEIILDRAYDFQSPTTMTLLRGGEAEVRKFDQTDQFAGQTVYFSDCILTGTPPESDGDEGLADVRALLAIEKAAVTGQPQQIASPPRTRHPVAEMVRTFAPTERRLML